MSKVFRYTRRIILAIVLPSAALGIMLLGSIWGALAIIGVCTAFLWVDHTKAAQ
jgi:hypothetical protein